MTPKADSARVHFIITTNQNCPKQISQFHRQARSEINKCGVFQLYIPWSFILYLCHESSVAKHGFSEVVGRAQWRVISCKANLLGLKSMAPMVVHRVSTTVLVVSKFLYGALRSS